MAKSGFFNYPQPTKAPRQRSIDIDDLFLTRYTAPWSRPSTLHANVWRGWILQQPVAMVCRETLIATLLSLDWKITPRNSAYREELEPTIRHYTKLFANGGNYGGLGLDYAGLIEWIAGDVLDTPFGGAAELGRKTNSEDGRVMWIRPLDAGTLYPTLNEDFPVVQMYLAYDAVAFPAWAISRTFMSPHSFLLKEGWGMAPPEKIYFALEMLNRGDKYYANLLLDVPTAGILDLGDMEKDSAEEWITAFKSFVADQSVSFRIPVLYEHNNPIEWIPFGKVPNDIMFNQITLKYAALVAAAYGMSLSDIGLQTTSSSGETLAGSIRQERRTKKTGFARMKSKMKSFFDRILPDTIEFNFIDYDDELNVALGKARLASSQAFSAWRQIGLFSPQELRSQSIQDGLVSITMPDALPPDAKPPIDMGRTIRYVGEKDNDKPNKEPELLGDKVAPSAGGEGEIRSLDSVSFKPKNRVLNTFIDNIIANVTPKLVETLSSISDDEVEIMKSVISESVFSDGDELEFGALLSTLIKNKSLGTFSFGNMEEELATLLGDEYENVDIKSYVHTLQSRIRSGVSDFIGRAVLLTVLNSENLTGDELFDDVKTKINNSLNEYLSAHVGIETQAILEEIRNAPTTLPDSVRVKSLGKKYPIAPATSNITVNIPERKSDIHVNTPEQSPPVVNVHVPEMKSQIDVHVPEQQMPDVIVRSPIVNVAVPEQSAPIVNVSMPDSPAPIVNVSNTVNPTPVEITNPVTVNVPKVSKEQQTVFRDQWGNIAATETEMIYTETDDDAVEDE